MCIGRIWRDSPPSSFARMSKSPRTRKITERIIIEFYEHGEESVTQNVFVRFSTLTMQRTNDIRVRFSLV